MSIYDTISPRELKLAKQQAATQQVIMAIRKNKEKAKQKNDDTKRTTGED